MALEIKGIPYQYIECSLVDKPKALLEISPAGLVPAIRHGPTWSLHESGIILEYLEELSPGLLPPPDEKQARASARLWASHAGKIPPIAYHLGTAADKEARLRAVGEAVIELQRLIKAADPAGPFFTGEHFGWVDIHVAPWIVRLSRTLVPEPGTRWEKWVNAVKAHPAIKATTSDDQAFVDSFRQFEEYEEYRNDPSQVAEAIKKAGGIP